MRRTLAKLLIGIGTTLVDAGFWMLGSEEHVVYSSNGDREAERVR